MKAPPSQLQSSGIAFLLTVIWGDPFIRLLRQFKIGKIIRVDVPESHLAKMNTPTMGGIMFLLPVTLLTNIFNAVSLFGSPLLGNSILVPLGTMWGFAIIGAIDDWEGIRGPRRGLGMRSRTKFILQVVIALVVAYILQWVLDVPSCSGPLHPYARIWLGLSRYRDFYQSSPWPMPLTLLMASMSGWHDRSHRLRYLRRHCAHPGAIYLARSASRLLGSRRVFVVQC